LDRAWAFHEAGGPTPRGVFRRADLYAAARGARLDYEKALTRDRPRHRVARTDVPARPVGRGPDRQISTAPQVDPFASRISVNRSA